MRLTVCLFAIAVVPLCISGFIIYFQRVKAIKTTEFQKLAAIRDLKVNNLQNWIDERKGDIRIMSEDKSL